MADTMTPEQRHKCMSHIRSKETGPELALRKMLFHKGFRYRLYDRRLPGTPDIVLPGSRTAIFVNGCFWHGHKDCRLVRIPKTNTEFWRTKIRRNIVRDEKDRALLEALGWNVLTVWECELNKSPEDTAERVCRALRENASIQTDKVLLRKKNLSVSRFNAKARARRKRALENDILETYRIPARIRRASLEEY